MSELKCHAIRLLPNDDLKRKINTWAIENNISAAIILSCVGSLSSLRLRLANSTDYLTSDEKFEILSLNGTLSKHGLHLHLSGSNSKGHCVGGHLADGNIIFTTCELVIAELPKFEFVREKDPRTGFLELKINY